MSPQDPRPFEWGRVRVLTERVENCFLEILLVGAPRLAWTTLAYPGSRRNVLKVVRLRRRLHRPSGYAMGAVCVRLLFRLAP